MKMALKGWNHRTATRRRTVACLTAVSLSTAFCCLPGGGPVRAEPPSASAGACERAGAAAEQASGLPAGLLLAIGQIESGRWNAVAGRVTPWPWTINTGGKGQWFETKEDAVRAVRAARDSGVRSIDIGCFQINLSYHPAAFTDLEQAFDPESNASYAARFLGGLLARTGSWNGAVESYHSADPLLGFPYRQQVFSAWLRQARVSSGSASLARPLPVGPSSGALPSRENTVEMPVVIAGVHIWTPMSVGSAPTRIAMPPAVTSGLDPPLVHTPAPGNPAMDSPGPLPAVVPHAFMLKR